MTTAAVCTCTTEGLCDLCRGDIGRRNSTRNVTSDLTPIREINPWPLPPELDQLLESPAGKSALHRLAKALKTDDWTAFKAIRFFLSELQTELVE